MARICEKECVMTRQDFDGALKFIYKSRNLVKGSLHGEQNTIFALHESALSRIIIQMDLLNLTQVTFKSRYNISADAFKQLVKMTAFTVCNKTIIPAIIEQNPRQEYLIKRNLMENVFFKEFNRIAENLEKEAVGEFFNCFSEFIDSVYF